jgi:eukaryotic-like serine/threonine-protein kinase
VPEVFGDYELLSPLAKGGMAELFRARDRRNSETVVVKRLLPEMEERQDIVDLFLTEADVGQMLRHENVGAVTDAGEVDGRYFIAMEYVDGLDAERLLADAWKRQEPISRRVAIRIAVDALRGLHAAHALKSPQGTLFGLVHRDVSPDNLFITKDGITKVADFGIAKLAAMEGATQAGLIKGKLSYMAPEQVQGKELDGRADAFSLALVLYEMLSSARPFAPLEGESEVDTLLRVRKGSVKSLRKLERDLPKQVGSVVDKALRASRFWRWQSCAQFADALQIAAQSSGLMGSRDDVASAVATVRSRL